MSKKFLDLECDILVLIGIYFAIRVIYTKEIYIQVNGYTVNTLAMLIHIIIFVSIVSVIRANDKETSEEIKSTK
jgi:hypothetical protein